ncbi:MAG: hypothetical protein M3Y22_02660 [Pseudomonadota bacterium]|nr:hypothetical protein [Pseudomonadota bacterium]
MSSALDASPLLGPLLMVIFRQRITAPDIDSGLAHLAASSDREASVDDWRTAVADAVAGGYIHDPVRLPAGALQCHWHLELTPKGVETARSLQAASGNAS